ncbi:MAG TPA: DNA-processing protein DprA [Burkholderiales bacterium]|nr:DNA-processing protein DprA [Burkholderiales bacterium]
MQIELAAWLRLSLVPGLGGRGQRKLLAAFGLPQNIFSQSRATLAAHIGEALAERLLQHHDEAALAATTRWLETPAHRVLSLADREYPSALLETDDPPIVLFVRGDPALLNKPAIAIVGSRNATAQGRLNAENFAKVLGDAGFVIVSGLALGIDTAAHRGALSSSGGTIAVLGTGIDRAYPSSNAGLHDAIAERGLLISEFPLGTPPLSNNFPRRNRLISGLARGVLVVEAALSSGSLITAKQAGEQGRDIYAIPGSIHSPFSRGCHALIRQGAKLVESAQDILEELKVPNQAGTAPPSALSPNPLIEHIGYDACSIDELCRRSGLTPESVSAMLLQLELSGGIAMLPGGMYQRLN